MQFCGNLQSKCPTNNAVTSCRHKDAACKRICHKYKLVQNHCYYDLRKHNFTNRIIPISNSLPNHVIFTETVNTVKKTVLTSSGRIKKYYYMTTKQISMAWGTVVLYNNTMFIYN